MVDVCGVSKMMGRFRYLQIEVERSASQLRFTDPT